MNKFVNESWHYTCYSLCTVVCGKRNARNYVNYRETGCRKYKIFVLCSTPKIQQGDWGLRCVCVD